MDKSLNLTSATWSEARTVCIPLWSFLKFTFHQKMHESGWPFNLYCSVVNSLWNFYTRDRSCTRQYVFSVSRALLPPIQIEWLMWWKERSAYQTSVDSDALAHWSSFDSLWPYMYIDELRTIQSWKKFSNGSLVPQYLAEGPLPDALTLRWGLSLTSR